MATLITKNSSTASAVPAAGDLVKGELAVNVTDKKVYTKDNSAAVVKLVGSLGNQEANAVAITGGTINGTTIGATTPSTGAFTTASASSGFTGNLTGNVTGNVSGTAANVTGVVAIANGGTGLSALGTGVQSALGQAVTGSGSFVLSTSPSLTTPNLGTPSAAVLTNATGLPLTTGVTGTLGVANGGTGITAFGTGVATALGQNVTGSGGIVLATSPSLTTPNLGTPSAATLTNATGLPIATGVSGLGTGVATALGVAVGSAGAFVVNGGALGTPSSGTVTNLTGTASININGTVGATTPTTGAFTTLSASGNITVSGGTANGVAYLNGSKVLTTGSALVFDGTRLKAGGAPTANNYYIQSSGGVQATASVVAQGSLQGYSGAGLFMSYESTYGRIEAYDYGTSAFKDFALALNGGNVGIGTSSPGQKLEVYGTLRVRSATEILDISAPAGKIDLNNLAGDPISFSVGSSEGFRLTSTGLGIGTTSPVEKVQSSNGIAATGANQSVGSLNGFVADYSGGASRLFASRNGVASSTLEFWTTDTGGAANKNATLDSSGNLGLGVTPSAWQSGLRALQIGATGSIYNNGLNTAFFGLNYYTDSGGTNRYLASTSASAYGQVSGAHQWYTAASGTAGNAISFTQAMTLSAAGGLSIGTTTDAGAGNIRVNGGALIGDGTAAAPTFTFYNESNVGIFRAGAGVLGFSTAGTERARITSGGLMGLGMTPTGSYSLQIYGIGASTGSARIRLNNSATGTADADGGGIAMEGVDLVIQNSENGVCKWEINGSERARIDSSGNAMFGCTTANNNNSNSLAVNVQNGNTYCNHINGTSDGTGYIQFAYNGSVIGTITQNGTTAVAYNTSSDYRLKDNPQPLTGSGAFIDALQPKTWNWKTDGSKGVGFIAHEVQEVSPGSVVGTKDAVDEEGKPIMQAMEYGSAEFIANIIAELQSLRARVAQLEAK